MQKEKREGLGGVALLPHLRHTRSKKTTRVVLTRESAPSLVFE